jgi:DNA-binding MarR family transcriptional regulator
MAKTVFERADDEKDLNTQLVLNLEMLGKSIDNLLWQQALEHELSPLQIRILITIRFQDTPLNASQLARLFKLSKATMSVAIRPLTEKKMLLKKKSEQDNRSSILQLTDWGSQIAHIAGFYLEPLHQIIMSIPDKEKEMILMNVKGILGKLSANS